MRTVRDMLKSKKADIWSIPPKATVFEALTLMDEREVGALVVMDEASNMVGIVSERDYARKIALLGKTSKETAVEDIMTPVADIYKVKPETSVEDCMVLITEKDSSFAGI